MFVQTRKSAFVNTRAMLLVVVGAVAGCAPLQQAPLVYTSSHVIGVKLGVAPTQPESMEAVIGYKDLDAAYAPVAVSNPHLDKAMQAGNKYDKDLYEIKEIYGIYGTQASAAGATQLLTPEESVDMRTYFEAFSLKEDSVKTTSKAKADWAEVQSLQAMIEQFKVESTTGVCSTFKANESMKNNYKSFFECTPSDAQNEVVRKYVTLSSNVKDYSQLIRDESNAKALYDKANAASQIALTNFARITDKVKGALEKLASIQKRDAISVYGSFDADTGAETAKVQGVASDGNNGVKVKVGKVFSTGVAAQNVSEAQKIVASSVVVSACINALGDQATKLYAGNDAAAARQEFIRNLMPECFKVAQEK